MPPKRHPGKAKKQTKNFVVLTPYKFKELLENGTIKFESAQIDISRIQKQDYVPEPEVNNYSMSNYFSETEDNTRNTDELKTEVQSSSYSYEYEEVEDDFADSIVDHGDQEVPTLKKLEIDISLTRICLECNREFLSYKLLKRHYSENHPHVPIPEKFICKEEQCNFRAQKKANMDRHRQVHHPSSSRKYQARERKSNRSQYKYGCSGCARHFKHELILKIHVNCIHRKLPLSCPVCNIVKSTYANLYQHVMLTHAHPQEKTYPCEQCDVKFKFKHNMSRHIKLAHEGERNFECPQCGKRFGQKISMQLHVQTVHLKIPYAPWVNKNRNRKKKKDDALKQEVDLDN